MNATGGRSIVILTRDGAEHHYVANRLCQAHRIRAIIVDRRRGQPSLRRTLKRGWRVVASKLLLKAYWRLVRDAQARHRAMQEVLGQDATTEFHRAGLVREVDGVRSADCERLLRELKPDLLLVYGTSIVPDRVLGLARDLALNMHTGISPWYRGTHCAFWPVVNGEPQLLGATVHECTSAVDGGRVFATAQARPQPGDHLHELFARAVEAGADAYVDVVGRYLAGSLQGQPQDLSLGHEYRGYMRTLGPELRARWNLRRGLLNKAS